jgi:hypothetical protein
MIGQELISIQEPDENADWFIIHTEKQSYDIRLGGIKKSSSTSKAPLINLPFDKAKIIRAMTDEFAVYIELNNGYCIVHSDTFIDMDGTTEFEINFHKSEFYINDGGIEGMHEITSFEN